MIERKARRRKKTSICRTSVRVRQPNGCWQTSVVSLNSPEEMASGGPHSLQPAKIEGTGTSANNSSAQLTPIVDEGWIETDDHFESSQAKEIVGDPNSEIQPEQRPLPLKYSFPQTQMISVADIDVGIRRRKIDQEHVAVLAHSFQEIEQTTPISLYRKSDGRWGILEGWHRFEATISLGLPKIWAQIVDRADVELRQVQISQNLHRKGLMALEQAISDAEWIETVRQKAAQVADPMGGRQPSEKGYSKAARELGLTPERMARSSLINSIPSEIQALIQERGLDDNQSALIMIAKRDASAQRQAVLELAERQSRRSPKSGKSVATPPKNESPNRAADSPLVTNLEVSDLNQEVMDPEPDSTLSVSTSPPDPPVQSGTGAIFQRSAPEVPATLDFPAIPESLKRADVETEFKKLKEEYVGSRLRKILIDASYTARGRFINEVFLPDFQKTSQEALAVAGDEGQS